MKRDETMARHIVAICNLLSQEDPEEQVRTACAAAGFLAEHHGLDAEEMFESAASLVRVIPPPPDPERMH